MNWLSWQIDYLLFLQNCRDLSCHIFDKFFITITMFGEVFIPVTIICFVYWCINKNTGFYILSSYIYGFITNTFLKATACIYRPWLLDSRVKPIAQAIPAATGYSFPSGHTASCVTTFGSIALSFKQNKLLKYSCFVIIMLVIFSRNYLGVHTPQDVIVSLLLGIIIVLFNKKLLEWETYGKHKDILIAGLITLINIFLMVYVNYKNYPSDCINGVLLYDPSPVKIEVCGRMGFVFGVFYGWLIEKRFINFSAESGSRLAKFLRLLSGLALLLILLNFATPFFINIWGEKIGQFAGYFLIGSFITLIHPFICKKILKL